MSRVIQDADIVNIIEEYVTLKKAGHNFKGLCPFHTEKTPSMVVSPEKQIFHCFGCHEGGDVVTFLMKIERMEFTEAVRMLADRLGIPIIDKTNVHNKVYDKKTEFIEINNRVASFYHRCLTKTRDAEKARQYLAKRGISPKTVNDFMLGFAPDSSAFLVNAAVKQRIDLNVLDKAGLIRKNDRDQKYHDWYRNRIIFPITDIKGRVIAFGARVLDNSLPKYINSPETLLFKKSATLYGLNKAIQYIRKTGRIIILEGYMDVISLSIEGFCNTAATLGTALTSQHIGSIRRYAKEAVVIFDGDNAGISASMRTIELFVNSGIGLKIVSLPKGLDPDDYIKEYGAESFKNKIESACEGFQFLINNLIKSRDITAVSVKKEIAGIVLSITAKIESRIEQSYVIRLLSEKLQEREEDIRYELQRYINGQLKKQSKKNFEQKKSLIKDDFGTKAEIDFFVWLITNIDKMKQAEQKINLEWITSSLIRDI
ncbi:DNA primase, partial [bacterium]